MAEPPWFDLDSLIFHADGESYPITRFLDADGDDMDGPAGATWLIAGCGNKWFSVPMESYQKVEIN